MGRITELPADRAPRVITRAQRERFEQWYAPEFQDAVSGRRDWDRCDRRSLRLYEGEPKIKERNFPVKNGPNLTVPLAGTSTDNVYSAIIDLIAQTTPTVTARQTQEIYEKYSRPLQRWIDHSLDIRWGFWKAMESALHDTCRGGTSFLYCPFESRTRKNKFHEILDSSPRIYAWPPEDVYEPAGSFGDVQGLEWIALREWMTEYQFADRAEFEKWKFKEEAATTPRRTGDESKKERERNARTHSVGQRSQQMYEILRVWATFDIDEDGFGEDLYCIWDVTARKALSLRYNRYDHKPIASMVFQKLAHMLRGKGIPELLRTLQDGGSDILTYWVTNMMLANTRVWAGPPGANREMEEIYPGKYLATQNADQIKEFKMSDVYNSGPLALQMIQLLAAKRIGEPELASGRGGKFGNRTPGITAITQVQQEVQRFAAAFKSMRDGAAESVRQCLYREQEQLLRGNVRLEEDMRRVLGEAEAAMLVELLKSEHFDEQVAVELTAGSPSVNREADKQNAVILLDRMFSYYTQALQLAQLNEGLPEGSASKAMTREVLDKANKFLVKMLQTFDQVKDPLSYIVALQEAQVNAQGLPNEAAGGQDIGAQLLTLLGRAGAGVSAPGSGLVLEAP